MPALCAAPSARAAWRANAGPSSATSTAIAVGEGHGGESRDGEGREERGGGGGGGGTSLNGEAAVAGSNMARMREAGAGGLARVTEAGEVDLARGREVVAAVQDGEATVVARPWWRMGAAVAREGREVRGAREKKRERRKVGRRCSGG